MLLSSVLCFFCVVSCVLIMCVVVCLCVFFFQAEDGIRDLVRSRGLGDVYKRQVVGNANDNQFALSISNSTDDRVRFIGSLYEKDKLDSLRVNCFAYIHGHSVGGTNPALLEAMVCKSVCLCHDNVFNREVTGSNQEYFKSASELVTLMEELEKDESRKLDLSNKAFNRVVENYSWEKIAMQYEDLFSQILLNQRR